MLLFLMSLSLHPPAAGEYEPRPERLLGCSNRYTDNGAGSTGHTIDVMFIVASHNIRLNTGIIESKIFQKHRQACLIRKRFQHAGTRYLATRIGINNCNLAGHGTADT